MFESEIEILQRLIKNNTIGNAHSISLKSILESNIPKNIKNFFKAEVEWILYQERKEDSKKSRFDYSQDDIRLLQEQTDLLLVYHFNFDQKEFQRTNDRCVHFLFNYLCRPLWTLENFLFDETNVLSANELNLKFRFCTDYGYYWKILEKYLASKKKTELSKEETVVLLKKIDTEIIRENSSEELARMTEPFFAFVHYIQNNSETTNEYGVPIKALAYFFEDKGVKSISEHLLDLRSKGKVAVQYHELVSILKNTFLKKGSYVEKETLTLLKPESEMNTSELIIPEKDRSSIIHTLFKNETASYQTIVQRILSLSSWEEAALELDHYFTINNIQPYSREAIVFTNALQSYFSYRSQT
jgi:hypothetical protein